MEYAECYQALFDLMYQEHDVILTVSEMDEIIRTSLQVVETINKYYAPNENLPK